MPRAALSNTALSGVNGPMAYQREGGGAKFNDIHFFQFDVLHCDCERQIVTYINMMKIAILKSAVTTTRDSRRREDFGDCLRPGLYNIVDW
jgi:hypothetical protein